MIDPTHLKAHRTAASLLKKGQFPDVLATYWAHQRRLELQAARGLRQRRTPARHALKRGADGRLQDGALMLPAMPKAKQLTRYDRCAHTYFSAICIAAAVLFWL
jgi:hypothetical protein